MPTLWQDLREQDFNARIEPTLFDEPTRYQLDRQARALAEPGSLFAVEYDAPPRGRWWIVACSASKAEYPAPAYELYTGSMFRHSFYAASAAADAAGGRVLILSARYGLIEPEREIEPYDLKLGERNSVDLLTLARQAAGLGVRPGDVITAMLPKAYRELLASSATALALTIGGEVELVDAYRGCRGIGEQRAANWKIQQGANRA